MTTRLGMATCEVLRSVGPDALRAPGIFSSAIADHMGADAPEAALLLRAADWPLLEPYDAALRSGGDRAMLENAVRAGEVRLAARAEAGIARQVATGIAEGVAAYLGVDLVGVAAPRRAPSRLRTVLIACACVAAIALVGVGVWWLVAGQGPQGSVRLGDGTFMPGTRRGSIVRDELGVSYVEDEIIVYAAPGVTREQVEEIMRPYGGTLIGCSAASNSYVFRLPRALTREELEKIAEELRRLAEVSDATPVYEPAVPSTDPGDDKGSDSPIALPDPPDVPEPVAGDEDWALEAIRARKAWELVDAGDEGPGDGVAVGVIDDQFFADHEDLAGSFSSMWQPYEEGFSAWYNSKNYLSSDEWRSSPSYDPEVKGPKGSEADHGTFVAGVVAAGNNDVGSTGVAWGCDLVGWQDGHGCDLDASGSLKSTAKGDWATDLCYALDYLVGERGCKVVNVSAGWADPDEMGDEAVAACADLIEKQVRALLVQGHEFVICVSAGNHYGADAVRNSPFTACDDAEVKKRIIVVGAIGKDGDGFEVADYSSGGERVDVLAPGTNVYGATYETDSSTHEAVSTYGSMSGTSMASPMVAGVCALAFKVNSSLSGAQVKKIVCNPTKPRSLSSSSMPERAVVDAANVVKRAKKAVGKAGRLRLQALAEDFVADWFCDWTSDGDGTWTTHSDGRQAYPSRLADRIAPGSQAAGDFLGATPTWPKDGWCHALARPTSKAKSWDGGGGVFLVTVRYVSTDADEVTDEDVKSLKKSAHKEKWRVGVNALGLVETVEPAGGQEEKPDEPAEKEPAEEEPAAEEPSPVVGITEVGEEQLALAREFLACYCGSAPLPAEGERPVMWSLDEWKSLCLPYVEPGSPAEESVANATDEYGQPSPYAYDAVLCVTDVEATAAGGLTARARVIRLVGDGRWEVTVASAVPCVLEFAASGKISAVECGAFEEVEEEQPEQSVQTVTSDYFVGVWACIGSSVYYDDPYEGMNNISGEGNYYHMTLYGDGKVGWGAFEQGAAYGMASDWEFTGNSAKFYLKLQGSRFVSSMELFRMDDTYLYVISNDDTSQGVDYYKRIG